MWKDIILAVGIFAAFNGPAIGQGAFDQFLAEESEHQEENQQKSEALEQFTTVLNGDDPAKAERAMKFMLESGDPELVRYASEFGLFSSDPRLQREAIRSIFQNRDDYRFVFDTSGNESAEGFLKYYGGVIEADKTNGYLTISIDGYSDEDTCWPFRGNNRCAFILTGNSVSLRGWNYASGDLTLNSQGELEGILSYQNNAPIPVTIDLLN